MNINFIFLVFYLRVPASLRANNFQEIINVSRKIQLQFAIIVIPC